MYKILLLLSLVFNFVFAQVDANLEVVKKTNALPKILDIRLLILEFRSEINNR